MHIGRVLAQYNVIGVDTLIGGNGDGAGGPISGLLGLQLLEQVRKKTEEDK